MYNIANITVTVSRHAGAENWFTWWTIIYCTAGKEIIDD
jgi:hypothetical protein